jgi:hypothetical protein
MIRENGGNVYFALMWFSTSSSVGHSLEQLKLNEGPQKAGFGEYAKEFRCWGQKSTNWFQVWPQIESQKGRCSEWQVLICNWSFRPQAQLQRLHMSALATCPNMQIKRPVLVKGRERRFVHAAPACLGKRQSKPSVHFRVQKCPSGLGKELGMGGER